MAKNFYLSPEKWRSPFLLEGQEAHHLTTVVRARPGEEIRLLDGQGREGLFKITGIEKHHVTLELLSEKKHTPQASRAILAIGWGKNARRTWLLEKAVEFEAAEIWFWQAERSQGKIPDESKDSWMNQMIAGAKQCGNLWLPEIRTLPGGIQEVLARGGDIPHRYMLWEEQAGEPLLATENMRVNAPVLYVIGPEGGFTGQEAAMLIKEGVQPLSLGRQVLRWETAALLCLGLHWWANQHAGREDA